jgi:hypothetical protein
MARALCGLVAVRVDGLLPPTPLSRRARTACWGAHLLGIHAEEVINLFALAIRTGIPAKGLKAMGVRLPDQYLRYPLHALIVRPAASSGWLAGDAFFSPSRRRYSAGPLCRIVQAGRDALDLARVAFDMKRGRAHSWVRILL